MRVKVYHDPITRKRLEGIADVLTIRSGVDNRGVEYCEVDCRFEIDAAAITALELTADMDDDAVYQRTVHKDDFIDDEDGDIVCTDCGKSGVITRHKDCPGKERK